MAFATKEAWLAAIETAITQIEPLGVGTTKVRLAKIPYITAALKAIARHMRFDEGDVLVNARDRRITIDLRTERPARRLHEGLTSLGLAFFENIEISVRPNGNASVIVTYVAQPA